ncbi:DUF7684 family protein [Kaistella sp.]|uniref:DUF7684 family protein n=1 Tax=Kaistella sp. TaxID=2782235 RepID=UPI002F95287E
MTINDREIITVKYTTEQNWIKNIPQSNWLCILVDNDRQKNYVDEVISKIINNDVCYVCTVGQSCEKTHDLIDEEIVFREVDIEKLHLPNHHIMTTWHNDFDEGIWFAIFAAHHEEVSIDKIVVLDMTDGNEFNRIDKLLTDLKVNGEKNGI